MTAAADEGGAAMATSTGADRLPECYGDVCITCSDQAVEVTVVALLDDQFAVVDTGSADAGSHQEIVSVALVSAEVGDTILVHAREAIATIRR
jgi:hydrogenase expression/formation protein HypC